MCFDRRQLYVNKHRLIILFFYLRGLWFSMTAWASCFWFILISDLLSVIVAVLEDAGQRGGAWFIAADKTVFLACFSGAGGAKDAEMEGCCWAEQAEGWGRKTARHWHQREKRPHRGFRVFLVFFYFVFYFVLFFSADLSGSFRRRLRLRSTPSCRWRLRRCDAPLLDRRPLKPDIMQGTGGAGRINGEQSTGSERSFHSGRSVLLNTIRQKTAADVAIFLCLIKLAFRIPCCGVWYERTVQASAVRCQCWWWADVSSACLLQGTVFVGFKINIY